MKISYPVEIVISETTYVGPTSEVTRWGWTLNFDGRMREHEQSSFPTKRAAIADGKRYAREMSKRMLKAYEL